MNDKEVMLVRGLSARDGQADRVIPRGLDSIYGFCYCNGPSAFRYKGLLSCYIDNHASIWEIGLGEAVRASGLYKKGYPVKKIRKMVEQAFKR
jgi:hypothetical protein